MNENNQYKPLESLILSAALIMSTFTTCFFIAIGLWFKLGGQ